MNDTVKVSVIYYSATGTVTELARSIAEFAEKAGAEVRLRKLKELAPQAAIDSNPDWGANLQATADIPEATPDDIVWADAVVLGSPTRYGNIAAQLKQYLDTLGPQWEEGLLEDKVYSGFTASQTNHGGQESTAGAVQHGVPLRRGAGTARHTDEAKYADGNPYGTSHVSGDGPVNETTRSAAAVQAERVVAIASALMRGR